MAELIQGLEEIVHHNDDIFPFVLYDRPEVYYITVHHYYVLLILLKLVFILIFIALFIITINWFVYEIRDQKLLEINSVVICVFQFLVLNEF